MQNVLALSCSGAGLELSRPIPAQSMCLWIQQGQPGVTLRGSFPASPAFLNTRAAGWGQHPAVCWGSICAHVLLSPPCSLPSCPALSDEHQDQNQIFYCSVISNFNQQIRSQPPWWKYWKQSQCYSTAVSFCIRRALNTAVPSGRQTYFCFTG